MLSFQGSESTDSTSKTGSLDSLKSSEIGSSQTSLPGDTSSSSTVENDSRDNSITNFGRSRRRVSTHALREECFASSHALTHSFSKMLERGLGFLAFHHTCGSVVVVVFRANVFFSNFNLNENVTDSVFLRPIISKLVIVSFFDFNFQMP